MVEFLIYNICVELCGHVYQQTVGIPIGTSCAPLVLYVFLHSYETEVVQHLQKIKKQKTSFNLTFRYIDDVLSLNKPSSMIVLILLFIRRNLRLKILHILKKWANYLDLLLEFDEDGKLFTRLFDKSDDFDFPIVNFPYVIQTLFTNLIPLCHIW